MPQPDSSIAAAGPIGFDPFEVTRLRDELALLRFLDTVRSHLRNTRDAESALRFIVRAAKDHFDISSACLAVTHGAAQPVQMLFAIPQEHIWPIPTLTALLRGEKTPMRPDTMFVRIRRRERLWGVLALHRVTGEFDKSQRQALGRVGSAISDVLREIDSQRIR